MMSAAHCGPSHPRSPSLYDSAVECAPRPSPPPSIVIAGMPRLIGRFASVLDALVGEVNPSAFPAARAARTVGALSGCAPVGRMPIGSILTDIRTRELGHRAFSAARALRMAVWAFADSDRLSMSIDPLGEIVFTDVPPSMIPTLKVTLGVVGTWMSAMVAIALPNA